MAAESLSRCSQSSVLAFKLLFTSVVKSGAVANVGNFFFKRFCCSWTIVPVALNIVPVAFKVLFLCQV